MPRGRMILWNDYVVMMTINGRNVGTWRRVDRRRRTRTTRCATGAACGRRRRSTRGVPTTAARKTAVQVRMRPSMTRFNGTVSMPTDWASFTAVGARKLLYSPSGRRDERCGRFFPWILDSPVVQDLVEAKKDWRRWSRRISRINFFGINAAKRNPGTFFRSKFSAKSDLTLMEPIQFDDVSFFYNSCWKECAAFSCAIGGCDYFTDLWW